MAVTSPRAGASDVGSVPLLWPPEDTYGWVRLLAEAVNQLFEGKTRATGSMTLTANAASTTLTDRRIGANSVIVFSPQTANAAAALSGLYVSAYADGSATLAHANNANADKTFRYSVAG